MFKKIYFIFTLITLVTSSIFAQQRKPNKDLDKKGHNLIQFSGVVVEGNNLQPIPYASILIKDKNRGTISDYFGYFSFVAQESDTIEFSAIGFSAALYIIPDTLSSNTYSLIQVLRKDTIYLNVMEVFPWPSKEQFKQAFLNLNLPDDDLSRATKNMDRADLKVQMVGMAMDASANQQYASQRYQSKLYYAGQMPPNNLLNPIAWAKFIKAWKNGDFKKKD